MTHRALAMALMAGMITFGGAGPAQAADEVNCSEISTALEPTSDGPLALATVFCQRTVIDFKQVGMISPDGQSMAYLQGGSTSGQERKVLYLAPLASHDAWAQQPLNMGAMWKFARDALPAYRWASNSSGVWAATREAIGPHGLATAGLQPVLVSAQTGTGRALEPPRHPSGPLEGLLWANGDGLALGLFGARGRDYRPPRKDPAPTFAMIDVKRGTVLDTLPFHVIPRLHTGALNNAVATTLPDGRIRAIVATFGRWLVWTQDESPIVLKSPYPYPGDVPHGLTISPDGSHLLVTRQRCDAGHADTDRPTRGFAALNPSCKPVDSVIATLHDAVTGERRWELRATVYRMQMRIDSAISDDGRHALIALPADQHGHTPIALVSMEDGRILQTIPAHIRGGGPISMGFLAGAQGAWTHKGGVTALYRFQTANR